MNVSAPPPSTRRKPTGCMQRVLHLPPQIALVGLEPDLAEYFCTWMRRHWPEARVRAVRAQDAFVADIAIVDRAPDTPLNVRTIWLADLERSRSLIQLSTTLWRTAMPTSARRLRGLIETCMER
jgi:hypothetical protein